jgi:DNA-binding GntR family transcriptional regulator
MTPAPGKLKGSSEVAAELRRRIADGVYVPGSLLPSSRELCAEFGVADGTVRRAIGELIREGVLTGGQGRRPAVVQPGDTQGSPHERAVEVIRTWIRTGQLAPGAALPTETELTQLLGVSRYAVREVVAELERSGEVVNRPGRRRTVAGSEPVPDALYEKVMSALAERIEVGELLPGFVLPSEAELSAEFNVSRVTVRHALMKLESSGVVSREESGRRMVSIPRPSGMPRQFPPGAKYAPAEPPIGWVDEMLRAHLASEDQRTAGSNEPETGTASS